MMKQQESILKWASCVLSESVTSLKAVQDVSFVKRLLFRIDDVSFSEEWQLGRGAESFSQVLQLVGKYFKQEIGTDISQHLQSVNVYRSPRDVWELLLGIAIKGNNRNNNISLIFEMDHSLQAELVKIVTDIIDKFGQNTAAIEEEPEEEPASNDRQMMVELAQENEVLRQECHRLETELLREKQERTNGAALRKELEYNLQMMRLEKFAFLQVMANTNRSNSKIFHDGDNVLQTQSNLSELAQDIVQFIRQQRKTIQTESQRNAQLEQQVIELRENIRRCVEENQVYLAKLGDLNIYQKEIHALREELTQKQQWNLELMEQASNLQDQKANLLMSLQKKAVSFSPQTQDFQKSELQEVKPYQAPERKKGLIRKETLRGQDPKKSFNSSQGERQLGDSSYRASEKDEATKRRMEDELRQPQLRNKLQRQVIFLKKTNNSLQKQIQSLKRTNEALQRSAKQFLDSNQQVIGKWEQDYESIITKMTALTKVNQDLHQENTGKDSQNKQLAEKLKQKEREEQLARLAKQSTIFESDSIDSRSNSQASSDSIQIVVNAPPKPQISAQQKSKKDKALLWDQIVLRLRGIVREGKVKQLSYESSLQALRNQNFKLLQLLRNKNEHFPSPQPPALEKNISQIQVKGDSSANNYFLNIQRIQSEQVRDRQASRYAPPKISYLQIEEGDQLEQSAIKLRGRMKSNYFGVNSRILNEITERRAEPSYINDESYFHFNKELTASIMQNIKGMAGRIEHDPTASLQLQKKMQQEVGRISKQYSKLNSNYQNVFNKLHIYTETIKQKQSLKQGYQQVLQQISKAQSEVKASHQAEIVQLRLQNQALRHQITENIIEKKDFMECITKLSASITMMKAEQAKKQQIAFKQMEKVLTQATNRFNSSIKDPLAFLDSCLQGQRQQGQLQKFYRLYIRERERTSQLNEQIQLLSSVLLEYRNMVLT